MLVTSEVRQAAESGAEMVDVLQQNSGKVSKMLKGTKYEAPAEEFEDLEKVMEFCQE